MCHLIRPDVTLRGSSRNRDAALISQSGGWIGPFSDPLAAGVSVALDEAIYKACDRQLSVVS